MPNADDRTPWWTIKTAAGEKPFTVSVSGPIHALGHVEDVEFICNYNDEGSRERLASIDEKRQVLTITPRMKFNLKCFGNDWSLGKPEPGKACYLENALEMLDQPGEWYLDRQTGVLSYWPRPGEDLTRDEVTVPVAQKTLVAIRGTREKPVMNLHLKGLHVAYVDWPLPESGYMGLFCCNVAVGSDENPGHRFIEAAVEFTHAQGCDFVDGGIAHVGGCGLCLREGTGYNTIEGNEIRSYTGRLAKADERFYQGTFFGNCGKSLFRTYLGTLGDLPILSDVAARPVSDLAIAPAEGQATVTGKALLERGLSVRLADAPAVGWIVYQRRQ